MERTQLMLESEHAQFLADEAARLGVSMSELVRRWIGEKMEGASQAGPDAGDALIGLGRHAVRRALEELPVSESVATELARIRATRGRAMAKGAAGD